MPKRLDLTPEQVIEKFEKRREQIRLFNKKYYEARQGTPEWKAKCKAYYETSKKKKAAIKALKLPQAVPQQ